MLRNVVAGISFYLTLISGAVFGMLIFLAVLTFLTEVSGGDYLILSMFPLPLMLSGILFIASACIHHQATNTVLKHSIL